VIREGLDVLVASPTGTGKTLTGFLVAIDAAYRAHGDGLATDGLPGVLYVSPLRRWRPTWRRTSPSRWPASPPRRRASD